MPRLSLDLQTKQSQNVKQIQRMIMTPQMQQAIHLLQMPVQELAIMIEGEIQQNPVLENDEQNTQDDTVDLERLQADTTEEDENIEMAPEKELLFDEHNFEIIKRLDDDFRDYISEGSGNGKPTVQDEEKHQAYLENSIQMPESLFDHLMQQARETFSSPNKLAIAEAIVGNLDDSGFLQTPLSEIAAFYHYPLSDIHEILNGIKEFDPVGVGATSLQESLMIQLANTGKKKSLAYRIVSKHYEDLLHNRIPAIQKGLKCSAEEINEAIERDIARLDLHPGTNYSRQCAIPITPDVSIEQEDERLTVTVNNDYLPPLRINQRYMRMLYDETLNAEAKDFIKNKIISAKWLLRNIFQRNETIEKIALSLSRRQREFFIDPNGALTPLTMKVIAEELSLHESTIARAIANKYLSCSKGIFPLRYFFSNAYVDEKGADVSSKTVRKVLKEVIDNENKLKPLSDEAISAQLNSKGIPCARRTVAKYRAQLNIGNTQQRRKFN